MTGKELVGPLPTIGFGLWHRDRIAYEPPRNTLDIRAAACRDHHPACDCREAEFAEDRRENTWNREQLRTAAAELLAGHRLYDYGRSEDLAEHFLTEQWEQLLHGGGPHACQCTGCRLIRASHEYVPTDVHGVVHATTNTTTSEGENQ